MSKTKGGNGLIKTLQEALEQRKIFEGQFRTQTDMNGLDITAGESLFDL